MTLSGGPVRAADTVLGQVELIVLPPQFLPSSVNPAPSTYLYGLTASHDFLPALSLRTGIYHSFRGDRQLLHVPLALTYAIPNEYIIHLRPYIGMGFDFFVPSLPRASGLGYNLHLRTGLDYVIDNRWTINGNFSLFIPLPGPPGTFTLNLGVWGLGIGFGAKL